MADLEEEVFENDPVDDEVDTMSNEELEHRIRLLDNGKLAIL